MRVSIEIEPGLGYRVAARLIDSASSLQRGISVAAFQKQPKHRADLLCESMALGALVRAICGKSEPIAATLPPFGLPAELIADLHALAVEEVGTEWADLYCRREPSEQEVFDGL